MLRLLKIFFKNYNIKTGIRFTIIGLLIIAGGIFVVFKEASITSEVIELITLGLILLGLNDEMLNKIRGNNNPDKPAE